MIGIPRLLKYAGRGPELLQAARLTPQFVPLITRYLEMGDAEYPFRLPLRGGGELNLADRSEVKVFWHLFIHGSYTLPPDCKSILDCGANVGLFSIWAARQNSTVKIVALEPFPSTFASLVQNIRNNKLEDRIQPFQLGLAAASSTKFIQIAGDSPVRGVVPGQESAKEGTIAINCDSLSHCMERFGFDRLDMLKMDIEGSEWEVLLTTDPTVLRRINRIQVEYHEVAAHLGYSPEKLFAHLSAGGHRLTYRVEDEYRTGIAYFELNQ